MFALIWESYFNIDLYENLFLCTNEIKIRFKSKFGNVIRIKARGLQRAKLGRPARRN